MSKLDIVIIQYNETYETLHNMLDSIQLQQAVNLKDIRVIICNIGGKEDLTKYFDGYSQVVYDYPVEYHIKDGVGNISATRKWGFELGDAPYIMFCDCDDMFYNMFGLHTIFYQIDTEEFDTLYSNFYEQHEDLKVYDRERDSICVHGKVFRRQFLIDNKIEWNSKLVYHEDNPFVRLAIHLAKKVVYIPRGFYLWRYNPESITREKHEWLAKTYPMLIDASDYLVQEFKKRKCMKDARWYAMLMIQEGYFFLNSIYFEKEECKKYLDSVLKRYKEFYKKYNKLANKIDLNDKTKMIQELSAQCTMTTKLTFDEWIAKISQE